MKQLIALTTILHVFIPNCWGQCTEVPEFPTTEITTCSEEVWLTTHPNLTSWNNYEVVSDSFLVSTTSVVNATPIVLDSSAVILDGQLSYLNLGHGFDNVQFPFSVVMRFALEPGYTYGNLFATDEGLGYSGLWFSLGLHDIESSIGDGYGGGPGERRSKTANFDFEIGEWYTFVGVIRSATDHSLFINGSDLGGYYSGYGNGEVVDLGRPSTIGYIVADSGTDTGQEQTSPIKVDFAGFYDFDVSPFVESFDISCSSDSGFMDSPQLEDDALGWYDFEVENPFIDSSLNQPDIIAEGNVQSEVVLCACENSVEIEVTILEGGCIDENACNYDITAQCDDGSCVYPPAIELGEDITSCEELVLLEAQDGQFFQWSTGESDSIIEVSQTGLYAVEASSQVGEPNAIVGHSDYYISDASISWEDARAQSESLGGHLAAITSPEENELVWQGVYGNGLNPGGTNNYQAWIGLYQDLESPDYSEPNGGWRWVTDEAVSYLNWAANRPANLDQGDFVHMTDANGNCPEGDIVCGTWDDSGISANLQSAFYVLEVESPYGSCTSSDSIFVEFNPGSCFCGPGTIWDAEMQLCIGDGSGDINLDGCVELNDLLDLLSAYGNCGAEESPWQCGDPLEYQGYDYETVQIGEQCWFAENLRSSAYQDGTNLQTGLEDAQWSSSIGVGAYSVYGATCSYCEDYTPELIACGNPNVGELFGHLYNQYAVLDERQLCPVGWYVPSAQDFQSLGEVLGGMNVAASHMKDELFWMNADTDNTINNSSGFSILPVGLRHDLTGECRQAGMASHLWTSDPNTDMYVASMLATLQINGSDPRHGFVVRCIKDAE